MKATKIFSGMALKVFLLMLTGILTTQFLFAQEWYNANWSYRRSVAVPNPGASVLTDLQVKITLNSSTPFDFTKAKVDGSDIRVTTDNGTALIPFWIESWDAGAQQAILWVKVPTIPVSGTTVFLYYGNSGATSLSDGRSTFRFFDDFESWNSSGTTGWTDIASTPTPAKADNTAAVFNSKLYVFGGYSSNSNVYLNEVFEYDPGTNTWTSKTPMPTARWGMVAVEFNGLIYVFSGQGSVNNKNEVYDPFNNTWDVSKAAVPSDLAQQGLMGVKYDDRIHLFYRNFHYEYNPANDQYTRKADVPEQLTWGTCATVGAKIYIIAGYSYSQSPNEASNDTYEYDPSTDIWTTKMPMPSSLYGVTRENPVINGKIYVTHGHAGMPFFVTNYAYDPVANTWQRKGDAVHARDGVGCGVINDKLYVVGGRDVYSNPYGVGWSEVYDPAVDTWVPPTGSAGWSTSGIANVYTDGTAKYQGNYGLKITNTGTDFKYAQSIIGYGSVYALDYNWNVTSLGSGNVTWPETEVRVSELPDNPGNIYFYNISGTQTLRWYNGTFTTITTGARDTWNKVTFIRNSANNTIIFNGTTYGPYTGTGFGLGTGIFRFGQYMATTQYLDNVRVRQWAGSDPITTVGTEQVNIGQWTGAVSSDWMAAGNWSSSILPTSSDNVTIPDVTNDPVISSKNAVCKNLTINSGASLTIFPEGEATIGQLDPPSDGALVNNGTLTLYSDQDDIASLIMNSYIGTGTANVQIYLSGGGTEALNDWSWHYISFPVDNLSVSALNDNEGDPIDDLAGYYENLATTDQHSAWYGYDGWDYQLGVDNGVITFNNLELGKGYNYYNLSPITRSFGGALFTGEITKELSYTGADVNLETKGWNLLGNPYTSSIDWDELSKSPYGIDNAIYFTHNNAPVVYVAGIGVPLGATARIPPMQGFFVKANQSARAITFIPLAMRHSDINRYKGEGETMPLVRLKLESQNLSDEAVVRFDEKANEDFDSELDAYKFSKTGTYVSLWTTLGSVSYTVNSIPFPETKTLVPVGINISESGTFSLSALQLQAIDNYDVFLTDKLTGITVNLRNTPSLNFTASQGMLEDRFVIEITAISTGVEIPQKPESIFNIYASNDFINIQTLADEWDGKSGSVDIIDMTGRTINKVENTEFWKNSLIQIPSAGYKGVYFIILRSEMMKYVGKTIIR